MHLGRRYLKDPGKSRQIPTAPHLVSYRQNMGSKRHTEKGNNCPDPLQAPGTEVRTPAACIPLQAHNAAFLAAADGL